MPIWALCCNQHWRCAVLQASVALRCAASINGAVLGCNHQWRCAVLEPSMALRCAATINGAALC